MSQRVPLRQPRRKMGTKRQRIFNLRKSLDLVRVSLVLINIVSISAVHLYLGPLRYSRPTILLTGLALVAALINRKALAWQNLNKSWVSKTVLGILVWGTISAPFGISMASSLIYIGDRYIKILVVFFLMVIAVRNARDLLVLIWSFVAAAGILLVLAATVLEVNTTHTGLDRMGGGLTSFDANDLAMIYLMALPLCILLIFVSRGIPRLIAACIAIGIPGSIALTGSRGALIGLAIVLIALFFALNRYSYLGRATCATLLLGGLLLGAPDGYWNQMKTILNPSEDYNLAAESGRVAIAKRGLGYMLRYPIFGLGVSNFGRAEGTISPIAAQLVEQGQGVPWIAPHNTYVQVGAELGIPGLVMWLALMYGGVVGLMRYHTKLPKNWDRISPDHMFMREATLLIPISVLGFAVTSFFLSHAYTAPPYILFAIVSGIYALKPRLHPQSPKRSH